METLQLLLLLTLQSTTIYLVSALSHATGFHRGYQPPLFLKILSLYRLVASHTVHQAFLRDTFSSQVSHDPSLNVFMSP